MCVLWQATLQVAMDCEVFSRGLLDPSALSKCLLFFFFFTSFNAFNTGGDQIKELPPAPCAPQGQSTHHCFGVLNHQPFHLSTGLTNI